MLRVLYVDDEPALRRIVQRMAPRAGFEVDVAGSDDEARRLVAENSYTTLVCDFILGDGVLGTDLLAELAARQPEAGLIMVSAFVEHGDTLEIDGRAVHTVAKPFTQASLLQAFECIADGRRNV